MYQPYTLDSISYNTPLSVPDQTNTKKYRFDVSVNMVQFLEGYTPAPELAGMAWWNDDELALNVATGIGPVLQVGQEEFVIVYNDTGVQIDNATAVYPVGAVGGRPSVAEADSKIA